MKKHFLLLLMAFVSLTGWAATQLTNFQITIKGTGAFTYTGSKINVADNAQTQEVEGVHLIVKMANATDALIEGQDYEVVIKDAAGAVVQNLINAGTYSVAATGIGNYTGETSPLIFTVDPKPLTTLTPAQGDPEFTLAVTGWDVAPADPDPGYFNYNGTAKTFATVVLKDVARANETNQGVLVLGEDKDYTMEYKQNVDATNGNVNNPRIVFTGHGNYQGKLEFAFEIKPGPLPEFNETNYTFTKVTTNPIYSGEEVTTLPTIVVKSGSTTLTEGTHYVIKWYYANGDEVTKTVNNQQVPSKPVNAGTYTAKVLGYGNYAAGNGLTYTGNEATKAWTLTVEKKALMVYVQDDEKVYDGAAVAVTNNKITGAEIVFNGLLDKDAALKENVTAEFEFAANVNAAQNAGEYTMKAVWADNADITNNYTLSQPTKGTYTIKQRNVKVKAENQTFTYDGTVKDIVTDKNETATAQAIKTVTIQKATVDQTTGKITNDEGVIGNDDISDLYEIKLKAGVVIKEKINEAYTGAIEIVDPQPGANNANPSAEQIAATLAAANYKIVPEAGNVVMNGMDLVLIAGTFSKEYGYEINFDEDFNVVNNAGLKAKDWKVAPTYKVTDEDGNEVNANTGVLPIGTYTIAITNASAIVPESNFEFTEDASHLFTGELTITKKKVEVVINPVSLNTGDGITELRKYATTTYTLVGDDEIAFTLNFADGFALDANSKLLAAGNYNIDQATGLILNAVDGTVTVSTQATPADEKDNANYIITFKKGAIKLGGAQSLYLDGDDTQLPGKIEDAAAACAASAATKYDVTFGQKELVADKWYTMVFPFATTPVEIVNALKDADGKSVFAIVNTLSDESTADHVSFKLQMKSIAANEPFLIKVGETIDMANATFTQRKIENSTTINKTAGGHTFQGVYAAKEVQSTSAEKIGWLATPANNTQSLQNKWYEPANSARPVYAMEAYLIYASTASSPIITVEEFDGTVTAIKAAKVDEFVDAVGDGWYTIGGMKLQGAPTQKGIYINNGKKVIIK